LSYFTKYRILGLIRAV